MKNKLIRIDMAQADKYATEYFLKICGLNREGKKYEKLLKQGMDMKKRIHDRVEIKAVVSSFEKDVIVGNTANIDGTAFVCNAFERINKDSIIKIYAYILTAGIYELNDEDPILEQLYADIWGTSYVDAGLEVLKDIIAQDIIQNKVVKESTSSVLDAFGPGFYGMDVTQIGKFFEVLDGDLIGAKVRANSLILPLKSCAGFFVAVDDETKLPPKDCKSCLADHKGCEFCQAIIKENK